MSAPPLRVRRIGRVERWGVIALLVALAGGSFGVDLWAVLTDRRMSGSDTFTPQLVSLHHHTLDGGVKGLYGWTAHLGYKGPLAPLAAWPLLLATGEVPLAPRLLSVLAHLALVLQAFWLARWLAGSPWAGLLAALVTATSPLLYGWTRLEFHEPLLAVLLLATLRRMATRPLRRWQDAALLGVLMGLGLLTKLAFLVFMVVPGLWFIARRVRDARGAALLGLTGAVTGATAAPWAVPNFMTIYYNFRMSTSGHEPLWDKVQGYLGVPEAWVLFGAALLSAVGLTLHPRPADPANAGSPAEPPDRWTPVLMGGCIAGALALFVAVFDFWTRYVAPAVPIAAVLAAAGLHRTGAALPRAARWPARALLAALAAGLLAYYVQLNSAELRGGNPRDFFAGMTAPDRRPYPGLPATLRTLLRHDDQIFILMDRGSNPNRLTGLFDIYWFRGLLWKPLSLEEAAARHARGEAVSVLMVRGPDDHELSPDEPSPPCPSLRSADPRHNEVSPGRRWLTSRRGRRCVHVVVDPDGMAYVAYRVGPDA